MEFSLQKYLLEKAQKKTHDRLEDCFFLDLSKFKESKVYRMKMITFRIILGTKLS